MPRVAINRPYRLRVTINRPSRPRVTINRRAGGVAVLPRIGQTAQIPCD